ncbi:aromatic ring-hydroxylating oxygenase subunit alpha [Georgenia sp. Z1491]|uniref:aromatic ring-hydroxylating oxygenase subunit alpha n=1 Tax=Georgenia sp. Z1491 TaxID=3416707 RepID=UPI003CF020E1
MTAEVDVRNEQVRRERWSDEDVFEQEMQSIFATCWQYLAHDSEIPSPGDYVLRKIGRDQVIVVRDENDEIQVLLNTCRHRGVPLCRADSGNTSHFRCSYHGWTYANTGALQGVTYQRDVYGRDGIDKKQLGLFKPAKVESIFGLVFATWDPDAMPLLDYLGDIAWYLETVFDKFPGGLEVVGTPVRNIIKANWKTEGENLSGDGYHTTVTHASAFELGLFATEKDLVKLSDEVTPKFTGRTVTTPHGHTMRIQRLPLVLEGNHYFGYPHEMWADIDSVLSPAQQSLMSAMSVGHGSIFPNMSFIENFKTNIDGPDMHARYIRITMRYPIDATTSEQLWFIFMPKQADDEWKRLSRLGYLRTNGPSGLFEIDDTENFVGISEASYGDRARTLPVTLEGGKHHPKAPDDLGWPGDVVDGDRTERTIRCFHSRWDELMTGASEPRAGVDA